MAEVKLPFKAARKGRSEPKLYATGDDAKGKDAEIGRALGCIDPELTPDAASDLNPETNDDEQDQA